MSDTFKFLKYKNIGLDTKIVMLRHHVQDIFHAERYLFFINIYKHSHERCILMVLLNIGFRPLFMSLYCAVYYVS